MGRQGGFWFSRERTQHWFQRVAEFGFWQFTSQAIQILTGFLLVRWMTVESYAQYGLVLGFQNMLGQLVDLGFSSSIIALVGSRVGDRFAVGRYVGAALSLRKSLLWVCLPFGGLAFAWFAYHHHWTMRSSVALYLSIVAYVYFQGWVSCYSTPLIMHHRMSAYYVPAVLWNAIKLTACWAAQSYAIMSATLVCGLNALSNVLTGAFYRSRGGKQISKCPEVDSDSQREIRSFVAPLLPGMIFYAFQSQIQVFLIAAFGKSESVGEVAALGRLGQLFLFLSAFNGMLLVPVIARAPRARVVVRYVQATALTIICIALVCGSAWAFPKMYLSFLGPQYNHLPDEMVLSLIASSLWLMSSTLYSFNNARRWVFHGTAFCNIAGMLFLQGFLISRMDLSNTRSVLLFGIISGGFPILVFLGTAIYGFNKDLRGAAETKSS
jgi:O-antigen/teichoic acid export membrane protein